MVVVSFVVCNIIHMNMKLELETIYKAALTPMFRYSTLYPV